MLRQLCTNLLTNAFLHGAVSGKVEIRSRIFNDGVETLVSNEGDAIPQAQRALFFDRFYRRDEVRQGRANGSGLGLSLAREIARAHGGELTLQPSDERWVIFRLWLPHH
jgi:signal transduction histidine kinase